MKRRGYIISAVLLVIDLLCFAFGGVFIALAAIIYALGIGEHIARVKYRVIPCDPSLGVKHQLWQEYCSIWEPPLNAVMLTVFTNWMVAD